LEEIAMATYYEDLQVAQVFEHPLRRTKGRDRM